MMDRYEYIWLFTGDRDTFGYATVPLARKICSLFCPGSMEELRVLVYGGCPVEEIGVGEMTMLERGFNQWRKNRVKG